MRHHVFTTAMGIVLAAAVVPLSFTAAAAADPTGYWRKAEQGERPGKMQVFRCGSGKRYLCAKIVWLQSPNDSNGRPLRDVRNENPSLRGRQIMGLPILNGMAPVGANRWKGNIYNPEDGNTYSATLTLVSASKIHLKGCKAWILCGERTWLRTSLPQAEPKPEPTTQVEASAEPQAVPGTATAAAASGSGAKDAFAEAEMMMTPSSTQSAQAGYRFLNASTEGPTGLSGDDVSSMFTMTAPLETDAPQTAPVSVAAQPKPPAQAAPVAQPRAPAQPPAQTQTIQANAAATSAPTVADEPVAEGEEPVTTETAEAFGVDAQKLTWRERRQLRRQQRAQEKQEQGLIPWLR